MNAERETPIQRILRLNAQSGVMTNEKIKQIATNQQGIEQLRATLNLRITDNRKAYAQKIAQLKPAQTMRKISELRAVAEKLRLVRSINANKLCEVA